MGTPVDPSARAGGRRWKVPLLATLATLAVLEVGFRAYFRWFARRDDYSKYMPYSEVPDRERIYRGHHYLNYCLNEGYESRDGRNRHNRLGYRGEEVERAKAPGTYRILLLGGSTTYDTSVADWRDSCAAQLQRILRERGQPVEVVNCGCGGWTSWESLLDLELRGLDLDPDLVVAYFGVNDVHARLVPPELYRSDNGGYAQPWRPDDALWGHSVLLRWIGTRLGFARKNSVGDLAFREHLEDDREADAIERNPPRYLERNLELVLDVCGPRGIDVLLPTFAWCSGKDDYVDRPAYQRGLEETNRAIRAVAERRGAKLYDLRAALPEDPALWADGRHNNEPGARRKAELYAGAILEAFGPALGSREPHGQD